ncbi:MAG: hypothetical protein LQ347_002454 [Umbilicaria vellea]|nr:MAG: hypothetical protein LQ347_002454 [Umbilicaria vellea]
MDSETSSQTLAEDDSPAHWRVVASHSLITAAVLNHRYDGAGTEEDPYVVDFIPDDPRNPMGFSNLKKWTITLLVAFATLAVSFVSSAYTGGVEQIIRQFGASQEVVTLGVSLFVLGFAIGPLLWAPLSELYGRQILFFITYGALTAFNAGAAGSQNIQTLIILRFFAGAFGSSPLTNAGGVIADMFSASQRGLAMSVFAAAPFMGPTLGPIVGGFLGEAKGWRWVEGLMAIFTGALWILGALTIPETYPPVLLRKRAAALSKATGHVYRSKLELNKASTPSVGAAFKTALSRPWVLLFREPIVFLLSITNYLIDAYTIYAASVLAANSVLRSLFGAAFPLFTTQMYNRLGIHWASSIPAFLALTCVPFPFLFYRYGPPIRQRCKFAREAAEAMQRMKDAQVKKEKSASAGWEAAEESGPPAPMESEAANAKRAANEKDLERGEV